MLEHERINDHYKYEQDDLNKTINNAFEGENENIVLLLLKHPKADINCKLDDCSAPLQTGSQNSQILSYKVDLLEINFFCTCLEFVRVELFLLT